VIRDGASPVRIVALAGGVGGAKLARGLQHVVGPELTVIVNTGDDLELHGLLVCPDHDTVMYTLSGIANADLGWGIAGETWNAAAQLEGYGEPGWFRLGDRDLATHLARTARLAAGQRLTEVSLGLQRALGVRATILPMADEPVRTEVLADDGWLEFQEYFVHRHQEPAIRDVRFKGVEAARATPEIEAALAAAELVVICPSNPIVSIGPILAVPGLRAAIDSARSRGVPVVAVSPIIAGRALKGPADRMLASLGHESSALGVARLYAGLVDVFLMDQVDAGLGAAIADLGLRPVTADTVMTDDPSRAALAREAIEAASPRAATMSPARGSRDS
jgi:LPPG:FO 2-phospho-L-lactate transferase